MNRALSLVTGAIVSFVVIAYIAVSASAQDTIFFIPFLSTGNDSINAAKVREEPILPTPPTPIDIPTEITEEMKVAAEPNLTVFGGQETAGALFFDNAIPGFSIKLPSDVYADGVITSMYCPKMDCPQPPLLVLRAIEDGAVAHVDGEGRILINGIARIKGDEELGVFDGVEIVIVETEEK